MTAITRFAPSPTGFLHIGHAASALFSAKQAGPNGRFLLRIEDIDQTRCRPEYVDAIFEDLAWLGLRWEEPVRIQSQHFRDYEKVLDRLTDAGLLYPCFCTRKDIQEEIARIGNAPHGPDGVLYPGTCRNLPSAQIVLRRGKAMRCVWIWCVPLDRSPARYRGMTARLANRMQRQKYLAMLFWRARTRRQATIYR